MGDREKGQEGLALLGWLYEENYDRVARYVAARIGNRTEAEDLASQVFIKAAGSIGSFKHSGAPVEAWLFKIAHNLTVDYLRKNSRVKEVDIEDAAPLHARDNPEESTMLKSQSQELSVALSQLTESQRQVILLRFVGELGSAEVAKIMGKRDGAVRELQSAALKNLRKYLASKAAGETGSETDAGPGSRAWE